VHIIQVSQKNLAWNEALEKFQQAEIDRKAKEQEQHTLYANRRALDGCRSQEEIDEWIESATVEAKNNFAKAQKHLQKARKENHELESQVATAKEALNAFGAHFEELVTERDRLTNNWSELGQESKGIDLNIQQLMANLMTAKKEHVDKERK